MTDTEFNSLRPGDKVCVQGYGIKFDARVSGPHNSLGEIPIEVVQVHWRTEDLDYVYKDYRRGHRTTEQNRPGLMRGWISEGVRRWD